VALQELQDFLIELRDLLIDGRVRAPFKDQPLRITNITVQLIRKTCGGRLVGSSECDLRRRRDPTKLRRDNFGAYRVSDP